MYNLYRPTLTINRHRSPRTKIRRGLGFWPRNPKMGGSGSGPRKPPKRSFLQRKKAFWGSKRPKMALFGGFSVFCRFSSKSSKSPFFGGCGVPVDFPIDGHPQQFLFFLKMKNKNRNRSHLRWESISACYSHQQSVAFKFGLLMTLDYHLARNTVPCRSIVSRSHSRLESTLVEA